MWPRALPLLLLARATLAKLVTTVEETTGAWVVAHDGEQWFAGSGAGVMIRYGGKEYTTEEGNLVVGI